MNLRAVRAQARAEVGMTLRRADALLLAVVIPVLLLVFFSLVKVLPSDTAHPVDFLAPGIISLAIMSTSMVSLGIATAFERSYGVLKRLGATPLGRPSLLAAKTASVIVVELVQAAVIVPVAFGLGWRPLAGAWPAGIAVGVLGTAAFVGVGMLMAGSLRAEATLAGANGLYLVLLLLGGMLIPLSKLPGGLRVVARALPSGGLSDGLAAALGTGPVPAHDWIVLAAWAVGAPLAAALTFRWE